MSLGESLEGFHHPTAGLGRVLLVYVRTERVGDLDSCARFMPLLSAAEKQRFKSFLVDEPRLEFIIGKALVRRVLGKVLKVPGATLSFGANGYGRPELQWETPTPPLVFNLSHTRGLVACALSLEGQVGVDVEHRKPRKHLMRLAQKVFSDAEFHPLQTLAPQKRERRFFELWTLKESYIKARGMGLALPLKKFSFDLREDRSIGLTLAPELEDEAEGWFFRLLTRTPNQQMAIAAKFPTDRTVDLRVHEFTELYV